MKTAVVTGGSRGIGYATVKALAYEGFTVNFTYLNSSDSAKALEKEMQSKGYNVISHKCDIKNFSDTKNLVNDIINSFGKIDLAVNNAGISHSGLFTETDPDQWDLIIRTNLTGCYNLCHATIPNMVKHKSGSIINISSVWGETGASMEVAYSTAKAGLIGFTKSLAKELGPSGIRVNALCPGVINTDMLSDYTPEELYDLKLQTPLMRLGAPEDIADAVCFLASEKSGFITGQILGVNGGFYI